MRKFTYTGNYTKDTVAFTVQYPDEIGFAFNPCLFTVEATGLISARVDLSVGGTVKNTATCDAFGNKAILDVREYVQSLFDEENLGNVDYTKASNSKLGLLVGITVYATFSTSAFGGSTHSNINIMGTNTINVFYIWGALQPGGTETFNASRKMRCWRGYPFTIGVYANGSGSVLMKRNGVPTDFTNITEQGMWNIPLAVPETDKESVTRYYVLSDVDKQLSEADFTSGTFDNTFDLTFLGIRVDSTDKVRVEVADDAETYGKDGVYLRWINRHGFYCYWLFKKGQESRKTTADGQFLRNNLLAYDQTYGYGTGFGRQQGYTRQDTYPVCAPMVDEETWNFIFDVCTSPIVEMLTSWDGTTAKWTSVTVAAGTFTRTKDILQDFVASINLNETPIQKL